MAKEKKINKVIKKGIRKVTIKDGLTATQQLIKHNEKELLKDLIHDKQLLELMTQEQNMQKVKNRFEHRISIIDATGNILITATKFSATITDVINAIGKHVSKGEHTEAQYTDGKLIQTGFKSVQKHKKGHVARIQITSIFRKAI